MLRPRWPMIVLRRPRAGPAPRSSTAADRGTSIPPGADHSSTPSTRACRAPRALDESYRPEELFDEDGRLVPELAALAPTGDRRMGSTPSQRAACCCETCGCRTSATTRWRCLLPARSMPRTPSFSASSSATGWLPQRRTAGTSGSSVPTRRSPPLGGGLRSHQPAVERPNRRERRVPRTDGRVLELDALRAPERGLAGGLPPHRAPRAVQLLRGLHPHRRLDVQPARQVAEGHLPTPVAPGDRLAELPARLPCLAADHNGFTHQDPGFLDTS